MTAAVTRGAARLLIDWGYAPVLELTLANGRRADIAAISPKGEIIMVEVKSCKADFDVDQKWPEYKDYCDRFYFAVADSFPQSLLPPSEGVIVADAFGGGVIRESELSQLSGARRKAVLIRIARHAAFRSIATVSD
ncbi:MAG: MmcB family DNA repair protein [Pseudomonadota bacterium]